jgi:ATP-dependent DNA helicase HFM1/MER3
VEDERALEVEEEKFKILNEKTVFDHIREKAKNFSLLSSFENIRCPSVEVLLGRNHAREKWSNHGREKRSYDGHEIVVLDDDDNKVPGQTDVNFPADLRKAVHEDVNLSLTLNDHNIAESSDNMSSVVDTGTPFH